MNNMELDDIKKYIKYATPDQKSYILKSLQEANNEQQLIEDIEYFDNLRNNGAIIKSLVINSIVDSGDGNNIINYTILLKKPATNIKSNVISYEIDGNVYRLHMDVVRHISNLMHQIKEDEEQMRRLTYGI